MKRVGTLFLHALGTVMALLVMTGCVKNEFKVKFDLPSDIDRTYTLLYYASDPSKGWIEEDVVNVIKGKAEVTVPTVNPGIVYVFRAGGKEPQAIFYVERGDRIDIKGENGNPADWNISGNKVTDDITRWRLDNSKLLSDSHRQGGEGKKQLNRSVYDYVTNHPSDAASAILMLEYFDRRTDESLFRAGWNKLKDEAAEEKWKELVSRSDMSEDVAPVDKLPAVIVLKTIATGCDTIVPGRVPVLLYFTKNNVKSHKDDIAELKKLSREFPDSSSRIIADISFEPDSMARLFPVRTDSLRLAVRGWMPLGVSDIQARKMGVSRLPYLIIADGKGTVVYRGDNMEEAAAKFRNILKNN